MFSYYTKIMNRLKTIILLFMVASLSIFNLPFSFNGISFFPSAMAQILNKTEPPSKNSNGQVEPTKEGSQSKKSNENLLIKRSTEDPTLYSFEQIEMLQKLVDRREFIEAQFEELALREGILGAAEKRIDKKIQEMRRLELALKKLISNKVKR